MARGDDEAISSCAYAGCSGCLAPKTSCEEEEEERKKNIIKR